MTGGSDFLDRINKIYKILGGKAAFFILQILLILSKKNNSLSTSTTYETSTMPGIFQRLPTFAAFFGTRQK